MRSCCPCRPRACLGPCRLGRPYGAAAFGLAQVHLAKGDHKSAMLYAERAYVAHPDIVPVLQLQERWGPDPQPVQLFEFGDLQRFEISLKECLSPHSRRGFCFVDAYCRKCVVQKHPFRSRVR